MEYVKKVLHALQKEHLLVKIEKCEFHKQCVKFLRFILTDDGIKMDRSKVQAILEWPQLKNVKEL